MADGTRDSSTPVDGEKMLLKPSGTWYKTTCLDFWNYIKGKISSVLGLTASSYGGSATSVLDYGDTNRVIKIGYATPSLTSVRYLAGYNNDGTAIKDIASSNVSVGHADVADRIRTSAPSSPQDGDIWIG